MVDIPKSIWKQTDKGVWHLFFNTNSHCTNSYDISRNDNPGLSKYISLLQSAQNALKLGSLIMTPKGFGRITKQDAVNVIVSFSNSESSSASTETFAVDDVSNTFYVYVKYYNQTCSNWYKIFLPTSFTVEQFKTILEELQIVPFSKRNFLMISNGIELKEHQTFESLGCKNGSKIIIFSQKETQYKVTRFTNTLQWWFSYTFDGITFSCNKSIRINGIGLYGSHEGKVQIGTIKLFEGYLGVTLFEEAIEVPPVGSDSSVVMPIMFKKSIPIQQGVNYTFQFISDAQIYIYYGTNGKKDVEGEKGVQFTFMFTQGSSHGSGVESGNFPEIYYQV